MLETITLEAAIKFSAPYAKKLFERTISPIITDKISTFFENKTDLDVFKKESVKYIASTNGLCSIINTIAFPNTPKKLEELYIPLTIKTENDKVILINDDADIFKYGNKVLINDTAGMGKSTLSRKICLNIIKEKKHIPVFIELRQLGKEPIANQIARKFGVNNKDACCFLNKLPLVYLFDGLDEVSSDDKKYIINEIRIFIDKLDEPKVLITSRLESYLSDLYDFTRYTISPLAINESFELISKYDPKGNISKKLIAGIENSNDQGLVDFLSTPLYVSLLFCAYRYKTVIPQKKHLFYSQVYEALFESHDLSKEVGFVRPKYSNLDSSEFHIILRRLGFWCIRNGGKIEFQKDELEILIKEIISNTNGINTNAVNFVKDLTTTVPLFLKEGSNLRWSHKSLMEYFSSMFICNDAKDKQKDLLLCLYESNEWSTYKNIFELCADIDYSSLRASVIKKVINDYISYYNSSYINITNKRISRCDIDERIGLSFGRPFGFKIYKREQIDFKDKCFWGNNNPDVLEVKDKCKTNSNELLQVVFSSCDGYFIHAICLLSRESMIINIIKCKSPELMLFLEENNGKYTIELVKSTIKKNKTHVVLDTPSLVINNSNNFKLINKVLERTVMPSRMNVRGFILDINKAKDELDRINTDSSNGIDLLIGNLI